MLVCHDGNAPWGGSEERSGANGRQRGAPTAADGGERPLFRERLKGLGGQA